MTRRRISTASDYQRSAKELKIHIAVADFLRRAAHHNLIWYHPANEGARSVAAGAKLKAMGMLPGVADFAFVLPGGKAAFLEIKAEDGKLSPDQVSFQILCTRVSVPFAIARSLDEAKLILLGWGALRQRTAILTRGA